MIYHAAFRLLEGELVLLVTADADAWIQPSAISAASSLALLRFLPSYQKRAATVCPLIVTREDQAVRPPAKDTIVVSGYERQTHTPTYPKQCHLLQFGPSCLALHSRPWTRPEPRSLSSDGRW